jgi:excisionase family DNA binding protein
MQHGVMTRPTATDESPDRPASEATGACRCATEAPAPSLLLDVAGVAALLACSERHVRRLADSGRMPRPVRLGTLIRWNRAEIEKWIAAGCPTGRPGASR